MPQQCPAQGMVTALAPLATQVLVQARTVQPLQQALPSATGRTSFFPEAFCFQNSAVCSHQVHTTSPIPFSHHSPALRAKAQLRLWAELDTQPHTTLPTPPWNQGQDLAAGPFKSFLHISATRQPSPSPVIAAPALEQNHLSTVTAVTLQSQPWCHSFSQQQAWLLAQVHLGSTTGSRAMLTNAPLLPEHPKHSPSTHSTRAGGLTIEEITKNHILKLGMRGSLLQRYNYHPCSHSTSHITHACLVCA